MPEQVANFTKLANGRSRYEVAIEVMFDVVVLHRHVRLDVVCRAIIAVMDVDADKREIVCSLRRVGSFEKAGDRAFEQRLNCLLYTSPSPRDS